MRRFARPSLLLSLVLLVALAVPAAAAEWAPNVFFSIGTVVTFQGPSFRCMQAHLSQIGWEPPNAPALWLRLSGSDPTPTSGPRPTATPTPRPGATMTPTPTPTTPTGGCSAQAWNA